MSKDYETRQVLLFGSLSEEDLLLWVQNAVGSEVTLVDPESFAVVASFQTETLVEKAHGGNLAILTGKMQPHESKSSLAAVLFVRRDLVLYLGIDKADLFALGQGL